MKEEKAAPDAIRKVVAPAVVLAAGRVALVVGNSTYTHIGRLPNPDNDAADMSAALEDRLEGRRGRGPGRRS